MAEDAAVKKARKAPAQKTAKKAAPPPGAPEPDQTGPAAADSDGGAPAPAGTITFRGRVMAYRRPTPDQLAVWKMIADRAQAAAADFAVPKPCPACKGEGCEECQGTGSAHAAPVLRLFDRAMTIISSVLIHEADKDWLEDELIAGRIDLEGASEIVRLAVDAMRASQPAEAPRTGPAVKARRRR